MTPRAVRAGAAGFSLPEVTLALGLLAGLLISICGLFVLSSNLVHGGRQRSSAVTMAENILEETNAWTFRGLFERFGYDGSAPSYVVDTRTNAAASGWQGEIAERLPSSHAEVVLESVAAGGSPPALRDATCIRVSVRVHWKDDLKWREATLTTVRM
ncbi:MAG TPA: hypothetical protein VD788_17110 [Candidatus Polarisedimenticolaceae bacterium]|nr:hypothetical protein [Candidatus Polarisedimenticolaceae bacterium]